MSGPALTEPNDSRDRLRQRLLSGEPLHFEGNEPEEDRTIEAKWLHEAARNGVKIDLLNAIIRGPLNLKYASLEGEISFIACDLRENADFSYATFKRNLILSRTTFLQGANFKSATLEHDGDLDGTEFLASEAKFEDLNARGVFSAKQARFATGVKAKFTGAHFVKSALFRGAIFEGEADFIAVAIGTSAEFHGANFKNTANFNQAQLGGSAFFTGCLFEGDANFGSVKIARQAAFQGSTFKRNAIFNQCGIGESAFFRAEPPGELAGTIFEGEANFNRIQIGANADFQGTQFKNKDARANFDSARINGNAFFRGAIFEGEARFLAAQIGGQAAFQGTIFKHDATFNTVRIAGPAFFRHDPARSLSAAIFQGKADFVDVQIGETAHFQGAAFKQAVSFNRARFGQSILFRGSTFEGEADFGSAHIGGAAEFQGATFKRKANFNRTQIAHSAFFSPAPQLDLPPARFEGEVSFTSAYIGGQAAFQGVNFSSTGNQVSFDASKIEGDAFFEGARFAGETRFETAEIGGSAIFRGATFLGSSNFEATNFRGLALFNGGESLLGALLQEVSFDHARFEQDAHFEDVCFMGAGRFRETSFRVLYFSVSGKTGNQDQFQGPVDLRGCTYERIQVNWKSLLKRMEPYDRQPYTQLEKVFRAVGEDREADKVYLKRRRVERKKKWQRGQFGSWVADALYALIARYGVRPYQLIGIPLLLLFLGMFFFSLPGAVKPKDENSVCRLASPMQASRWEAFAVGLHQFLPVEVPMGSQCIPSPDPVEVWMLRFKMSPSTFATFFLRLPGWILVPLGIAALTGLLRRAVP